MRSLTSGRGRVTAGLAVLATSLAFAAVGLAAPAGAATAPQPSAAPTATAGSPTPSAGPTSLGPADAHTTWLWGVYSHAASEAKPAPVSTRSGDSPKPVPPSATLPSGGSTSPEIVGGSAADISSAPWTVLVQSVQGGYVYTCGGTLIAPNKVLTAAHCFVPDGIDAESNTYVAGGVSQISQVGTGAGTLAKVLTAWYDPNFSIDAQGATHNDDAVLTLDTNMAYRTLPPAPSTDTADYAPGTSAQVWGWGLTSGSATALSNQLQTATLPIVADSTCATGLNSYNTTQTFCGGYANGSAATCNGDSGGPVVVNGTLIGIVSYGLTGCSGYSYFTRVSTYAAGIQAAPTTAPRQITEGVKLPVAPGTGLTASQFSLQANCCGVVWDGGAQLLVNSTASGDTFTAELEAGQAGYYDLSAKLTRAPDYGQLVVIPQSTGAQLGPIFDGYAHAAATANQEFGAIYAGAPGPVLVTFKVVGKNASSSSYRTGIDFLRLTPEKTTVSVEGENMIGTSGSSANVPVSAQSNCCGALWSGNKQLFVNSTAAGGFFTYTLNGVSAGQYDLKAILTRAPDYGEIAVTVSGKRVGPLFDGYASGVQTAVQDFGPVTVPAGGTLTFTAKAKDAASANYRMGIDRVDLTALAPTTLVEGESVAVQAGSAPTSVQANCCGLFFSGDKQLYVTSTASGQHVSFPVSFPATGSYDLTADLTQAPNYGQVTLSVDGTRSGPVFDGYAGIARSAVQDFGTLNLAAGTHTVTFTVTGKNAGSSGHKFGIDRLLLTDLGTAPTLEAESTPLNAARDYNLNAVSQANCCGVFWSGDHQELLQPASTATTAAYQAAFTLTVPTSGTYDLSALMTRAPNYGESWFSLDGADVGGMFEGYSGSVNITTQDFGSVYLTAGQHTLIVATAYHNPASTGDMSGIDAFRLTEAAS